MPISQQYAAQIERYVQQHRQELVDILIEMIAVPSVKSPALPGMPFGENCAKALEKGMEICRYLCGLWRFGHIQPEEDRVLQAAPALQRGPD